jgi:hypothetical protein
MPDFATLQPVASAQPDFSTLKPFTAPQPDKFLGGNVTPLGEGIWNVAKGIWNGVKGVTDAVTNAGVNTVQNIGSDIKGNEQMATDAVNQGKIAPVGAAVLGAAKSVTDIGGEVAKGAGDMLVRGISSLLPQDAKNDIKANWAQGLTDIKNAWNDTSNLTPDQKAGFDKVHAIVHTLSNVVQQNPETAKTVGNALSMVLAPSALEGGVSTLKKGADIIGQGIDLATPVVKGATQVVKDAAGNIVSGVSDAASSAKGLVTGQAKNDLQTIADTISPKLTAKEIKLAESQGRIVTGNQPTLLRGGTPDQILTSDKVTESAFTINKEIPNAAQMSQPDLYTALKARTTDMAQQLEPEMRAVTLKPETIDSMKEDVSALQKSQLENADATEEANVAKRQKQFNARLAKITPQSTLDDVWKERIALDDATPANVKNANSLSDSRLQTKKEEWLQNRSILNNIINDSGSGLGKTSQQAFKDMSNMYDARTNLLSKAKENLDLAGQPSKVIQWMKAHPYITGGIVTGAASATGVPKALLRMATGL